MVVSCVKMFMLRINYIYSGGIYVCKDAYITKQLHINIIVVVSMCVKMFMLRINYIYSGAIYVRKDVYVTNQLHI